MFGKTGGTRNIHASLWAPGVTSSREASNYTNSIILRCMEGPYGDQPRILDLGCGTGATLAYLRAHTCLHPELTGITLSPHQAELAQRLLQKRQPDIRILAADYHHLPQSWAGHFHLAYAIESFVHSSEPHLFFQEAHRVLQPGGKLILIDTFPASSASTDHFIHQQEVSDYQTFWNAGQILDPAALALLAHQSGFRITVNDDLTPWVEKNRLRDRWIAQFNRRFHRYTTIHPYLHALRGGNAVQSGFRHGWLTYRCIVLESMPES